MISSTVVPLGSDLSSVPSCARAACDNMTTGNKTLNSVVSIRSKGSVDGAGREWNLINPILAKGDTEKLTAASTPRAAVQTALRRGWKTAVLPTSFDATGGEKLAGFTFLYFDVRALGMALAIPHSTRPGNNW